MHIATEQLRTDSGLPLPGLGPGIQFGNATGAAHQQGKRQVGGAFGEHIRRVGQHDPAFVEVGQVIVVVAHRDAGHHFQTGCVLQLRTTEFAAYTNQAMGMGQGFVELGVDVAVFRIRHDDVEVLLQAFNHLRGDAAECKDGLFHGRRARRAVKNDEHANILHGICASRQAVNASLQLAVLHPVILPHFLYCGMRPAHRARHFMHHPELS
ncbi:hypothetical protein D3C78_1232110 [compost metagenome]